MRVLGGKNFLILSVIIGSIAGGRYESPSSYQNQVNGDTFFNDPISSSNGHISLDENSYTTDNHRRWFGNLHFPLLSKVLGKRTKNKVSPDEDKKTNREKEAIFSYDDDDPYGPSRWGRISKECEGKKQSPVNLYEENSKSGGNSHPMIIDGFHSVPSMIKIRNSGHSVAISFEFPDRRKVRFLGGPLKGAFKLDHIHWHWGGNDYAGSEHTYNSASYASEMHLVTYNSKYDSFTKASRMPGGIAVIAIFYELSDATDIPFIHLISQIVKPQSFHNENKNVFSVRDLIKTKDFPYLTYKGSLTTPNCLETVTWIVSKKLLRISSADLAEFRKLKDERGRLLTKNRRPLQPLNYRRVASY